MGKSDKSQPRLSFEMRKPSRTQSKAASDSEADTQREATPSLETTLLAMQRSLQSIDGKIDALNQRMDHMSAKLEKQNTRIGVVEQRVSNTEDDLSAVTSKALNMEKVLALIQAKNEDLGARSRRNNLRITVLPESTNTGKMETYVKTLIKDIFGTENLSPILIVERAHRSHAAHPVPGAAPSPIIARLLNYRDRDAILRMARDNGTIPFQGNTLAFYPDFTVAVQAARREFGMVKKQLQSKGIPYAMLYPVRPKIGLEGAFKIFTNPKAALEHVKTLKRRRSESSHDPDEEKQ